MSDYEKVKRIVYRKLKNLGTLHRKTYLKGVDFLNIENSDQHLAIMANKGLIDYNLYHGGIDYGSIRLTTKGENEAQSY